MKGEDQSDAELVQTVLHPQNMTQISPYSRLILESKIDD